MQEIRSREKNIHKIFDDVEKAFMLTSEKSPRKTLIKSRFDNSFMQLFSLFSRYGNVNYEVEYEKKKYSKINVCKSTNSIVICVSGGKDSLATILYYQKKGYHVYLYHLRGINLTYKDEYKAVEDLADRLNLPLAIEDITLIGKQEWIEHPMKNMVIANRAISWAIKNDIASNIAFGNFSTSSLDLDPFDVCGGDCKEMWEVYEKIVKCVISGFHVHTPLENFEQTVRMLLDKPEYIEHTQSCIGPYRYREYLKKNNEKKYKIELPPHRCGSCWKCCLEYCIFCDNGVYEYNEAYYKHCIQILQKTLKKETGNYYNLDETWEHYFYYDRSKSKFNACK